MNKPTFLLLILMSLLFKGSLIFSQSVDTLFHPMNKKTFVISSHLVYNYYTNKSIQTFENPNGFIPNSTINDTIYYYKYKPQDTKTFDLSFIFNKPISNKFSFSFGLRFDQKKQDRKYITYIDSNSTRPDLTSKLNYYYSFSLPVNINYYYKRLKISGGNNLNIWSISKENYNYQNNNRLEYNDSFFNINIFFQETIAFQLFKSQDLYIQIAAEQSLKFYKKYGYYNFFKFGVSYQF